MGIEQGRRDDLESVGYLLVYLLKGALPWQKVKAQTKEEKMDKIMKKKINTLSESFYHGTISIKYSSLLLFRGVCNIY